MFKRVVARLRAQDGVAIAIELLIVIVGVFIGTWVANWNQERAARAETHRMIGQLGPTLHQMSSYWRYAPPYYATTRRYTDTALAGWRGDPSVSDAAFVTAAYQASQIFVMAVNGSMFSTILGTDRLREINDPQLRADLTDLMTTDYSVIDQASVDTPYRRNVRRIIPLAAQDLIRTQCGDRPVAADPPNLMLPAACVAAIPAREAAAAAALLRAHPDLRDDLQWHAAATATFLTRIVSTAAATRRVEAASARER